MFEPFNGLHFRVVSRVAGKTFAFALGLNFFQRRAFVHRRRRRHRVVGSESLIWQQQMGGDVDWAGGDGPKYGARLYQSDGIQPPCSDVVDAADAQLLALAVSCWRRILSCGQSVFKDSLSSYARPALFTVQLARPQLQLSIYHKFASLVKP